MNNPCMQHVMQIVVNTWNMIVKGNRTYSITCNSYIQHINNKYNNWHTLCSYVQTYTRNNTRMQHIMRIVVNTRNLIVKRNRIYPSIGIQTFNTLSNTECHNWHTLRTYVQTDTMNNTRVQHIMRVVVNIWTIMVNHNRMYAITCNSDMQHIINYYNNLHTLRTYVQTETMNNTCMQHIMQIVINTWNIIVKHNRNCAIICNSNI